MTGGKLAREDLLIDRVLQPFRAFARIEASGGLLLLAATLVALVWANSPFAERYFGLWQSTFTISLGGAALSKPVLLWINDGLMAVFFFVVGLEIKRELLVGELASMRKAVLPIIAALGGMVVPAAIYLAFNIGTTTSAGWGIPMATDIAFALGILALLGRRVPPALKVFLTSLAIIDDIGAVLVIALFYSAQIFWPSLLVGGALLASLLAANRIGIRSPLVYVILGIGLWLALLQSGVHATIAGVLVAMTIPAWNVIDTKAFLDHSRDILLLFHDTGRYAETVLADESRQAALQELETLIDELQPPLQRLAHGLHPWVVYFIVPLFALANAGVPLGATVGSPLIHQVALGIVAGLVIGKPLGIIAFTWLAVRNGVASLPFGVGWRHILGAGWLGGIGFTMSLLIAGMAFEGSPFLSIAKVGILTGSLLAGFTGCMLLRLTVRPGEGSAS